VLEKHFTAIPDVATPDRDHALAVDQFKYMVQYLRGNVDALQPGHGEERAMLTRHNRRIIATREIHAGEILKEGENFGAYRSLKDDTHALSPWLIPMVAGKQAKRVIAAGAGIGPGDV
jgi:sialic acid synthase SpsE